MTKDEILRHAGRELQDTSEAFKEQILDPALDLVLLDLVSADAIRIEAAATFEVRADVRGYDLREICGQPSQAPREILSLIVYAWGDAAFPCLMGDPLFSRHRAAGGETLRGRWQIWRVFPRPFNLEVYPPADTDNAGVEAQLVYTTAPGKIAANEDLTFVVAEDIPGIVAGVIDRCASFGEDTRVDQARYTALYETAKKRMWGRLHNSRPGRLPYRD